VGRPLVAARTACLLLAPGRGSRRSRWSRRSKKTRRSRWSRRPLLVALLPLDDCVCRRSECHVELVLSLASPHATANEAAPARSVTKPRRPTELCSEGEPHDSMQCKRGANRGGPRRGVSNSETRSANDRRSARNLPPFPRLRGLDREEPRGTRSFREWTGVRPGDSAPIQSAGRKHEDEQASVTTSAPGDSPPLAPHPHARFAGKIRLVRRRSGGVHRRPGRPRRARWQTGSDAPARRPTRGLRPRARHTPRPHPPRRRAAPSRRRTPRAART